MPTILMCDFDDTVVTVDTGALILDRFADDGWRRIEEKYDHGVITIEEAITREFSTVKASRNEMLNAVEGARFRAGFEHLLSTYFEGREPLVITSYGVDFCIEHIMKRVSQGEVRIFSPRSRKTETGMRFQFPKLESRNSTNLKDDAVMKFKGQGYSVIYVGDGASDLTALQKADFGFAIRGSKLAKACKRSGVPLSEISSFEELVPLVRPHAKPERRDQL